MSDLDRHPTAWLTTLAPDGAPHTTPVWWVDVGGALWVATSWSARKTRNVVGDPRVSFAADGSGDDPHVALGRASTRECADHPEVLAAFADRYGGWDAADPTRWGPRVLIRVTVDRWLMGGGESSGTAKYR